MQTPLQKGFVNILKERLDVLLVKRGIYQSRERAKASIMAGIVFVDGQKSDKAGNMVDTEA
ncbi:MAG: S4 domain-containing protein, partial [Emergencia timonensis]